MAISQADINTNWIELEENSQVGHVQFGVSPDERRKRWIIVKLENGNYAVFRFEHVVEAVIEFTGETTASPTMLNLQLAELPNLFTRFAHPPANAATDDAEKIRQELNPLTDTPPVILSGGNVVGVLTIKLRGGGDVEFFDSVQHMASANGGEHPPETAKEEPPAPGPSAPTPGTLGPESEPAAPPPRLISVRFEPPEQKDQPLQVGETYTLVFSVELEKLAAAIATAVLDDRLIFPPNLDQVDLFVQLLSEDFDILTDPQKLIVPREGKSKNRARFDIVPKHNGESELTAVFSRDGNAVQAITIKLNVGVAGQAAIVKTETLGRPVDSAGAAKPRGLSMWIDYIGEGFKFSFVGPETQPGFVIPLQLHELEQAINEARAALKEIVEFKDKGNVVYQTGIDIPPAVSQKTLPRLAEAGFLLFQTIFMHPGASQPSKDFAKRLRELAKGETLKIQVNSKEMMLPWGILYLADRFDPNDIKPELFLGLKHIIEHMPMEPNMDFPADIPSQPQD